MGHARRRVSAVKLWASGGATLGGLLLALGLNGCTDEKIVYRDNPLFEDPPAAGAGFLGYDEAESKLTVCGNCHVGQQGDWEGTAHADAWATLQASGHSQDACENCHTVGPNGSPSSGDVGWASTADARYMDVQCESCHGPGQAHVANPDATQPLASIEAGLDIGCAECHSGAHHPFVEEWSASGHATPIASVISRADPACLECHSGQGALAAWGVNAEYLEKDAPIAEHVGFTCAVCHDPHDARNAGQLRFPIDVPTVATNLCMKCHHKRAEPELDAATLRGPHSPQGPLLLGEAGWFPPGYEPPIDQIVGTHGTGGNPRLCASCHVGQYEVTDQATGDFVVTVTGHRFLAIPCVDANGQPTEEQDCEVSNRHFALCADSGCHGSPEAARSAYVVARSRIDELVEETLALIALAPEGSQDPSDGVFTVADGAWFNAQLAALDGTSTHNPFLAEQLLIASKQALIDEYDLPGALIGSTEIQLGR